MAIMPEMTKFINNMEKRMYNVASMLSILKSVTTSGIEATDCGLIEINDFILPREQFETWFIAKNERDYYKAYKGCNCIEPNNRTYFEEAIAGYYFYSYDEPIEELCPTYTIKIDGLKANVVIYVYYLG